MENTAVSGNGWREMQALNSAAHMHGQGETSNSLEEDVVGASCPGVKAKHIVRLAGVMMLVFAIVALISLVSVQQMTSLADRRVLMTPTELHEPITESYDEVVAVCAFPLLRAAEVGYPAHECEGWDEGVCPTGYECPEPGDTNAMCVSTTLECDEWCISYLAQHQNFRSGRDEDDRTDEYRVVGMLMWWRTTFSRGTVFIGLAIVILLLVIAFLFFLAPQQPPRLVSWLGTNSSLVIGTAVAILYVANAVLYPVYLFEPGVDEQVSLDDGHCFAVEPQFISSSLLMWTMLAFIPPSCLCLFVGLSICCGCNLLATAWERNGLALRHASGKDQVL